MKMHRPRRFALSLLLLFASSAAYTATTPLFGKAGVTPQAVRQGTLGSCYFHASIASLASAQPDLLRRAIQQDEKGNLSVRFNDGTIERVYAEDIEFARKSRYDFSDGLWVTVLFRGYAQRTLRAAMIDAVQKSALFAPLKAMVSKGIENSDYVLLAYDRAIRAQIDQSGNINRARLKTQLQEELRVVPASGEWEKRAVDMLDTSGFFEALESDIRSNGELFGAYRAVGQGGLPEGVLRAFVGDSRTIYPIKDAAQVTAEISSALQAHEGVVAWTSESPDARLVAKWRQPTPADRPDWFVGSHAYTVLAIDSNAGTVTVRNPWGTHPYPGGEAKISLDSFFEAYVAISMSTARSQN
jgi:Calpain family cysteine protease